MAAEMSEIIKKDMERVLAFSKEKRLDCVKLGQRIETSHPYKWKKIKENWDKIYPGLSLKVEVEAHIARSYDIQEPSGSKGGKE
jgi:spore germination protein KC